MAQDLELRDAIRRAEAETELMPSDGRKEAGNYRKGRFQLHGMTIVVENPKGATRTGKGRDGQEWHVKMPALYGYISRTEGADGDHVDVYVGSEPESAVAYIIDQVDAESGVFDEHKVMLGYDTPEAALSDYDGAFSDGRGPERRGAVTPMSVEAFKVWLKYGDQSEPVGTMTKAGDSTRKATPEGLLRAGAVLTRAGPIDYTRSELGLAGDGLITVHRTIESLRHPETLDSLRGAPVTLGHPPKGVTPDNWKDEVVGAVAGEPSFDSNTIVGDLLIGDREALKQLDEGVREISIGYDFHLGRDGSTVGPIRVNHVALVERGRAGSSVRVLDSLEGDDMPEMLTKKDVEDAFSTALDGFFKKMDGQIGTADMGKMRHDMSAALGDAMKPFMDTLAAVKDTADGLKTAEDARKEAEDRAAAEAKAEADLKTVKDAIRAEERARYEIMLDAMPLIPEDKRAGLDTADPKAVLVAAVGDSVPNAKDASIDYLRGVVSMKRKAMEDAGNLGGGGQNDLPPGVVPFTMGDRLSATDTRLKAEDEFKKSQVDRYTKAGGR